MPAKGGPVRLHESDAADPYRADAEARSLLARGSELPIVELVANINQQPSRLATVSPDRDNRKGS
jgi:hypothetical protein